MKSLLTIMYGLICIGFISISHYLWIEKTTVLQAADQSETQTSSETSDTQQETMNSLLPLTKDWPESGVKNFKQALMEQEKFTIVIAGSSALGGETGWAEATKAKLIKAYGQDHLNVEVRQYDMNSEEFIAQNLHQELANLKADMILLEPFILKNNGEVELGTTLANLTATIEAIKSVTPESVIMIQPANPIYKARIYPAQVAQLKAYAEENQLVYLDHWGLWPDPNSEEMKEFITADRSFPSAKGHQVWGEFVSAYLINQE